MSRFFLKNFPNFLVLFGLFCGLVFQNNLAFAESDSVPVTTYSIKEVPIKATSKTAVAARNLAMNMGRREGFSILLRRLNLDSSIAETVDDEEIFDMVRSERINDEKIAGKTYSAKLNITFAKSFVDHFLNQRAGSQKGKDIGNSDKNFDPTKIKFAFGNSALLIAAQFSNGNLVIWEEKNTWRNLLDLAIRASKNKDPSQNFVLLQKGADESSMVNAQNLTSIKFGNVESLLNRYRVNLAYVVTFNYNEEAKKAVVEVILLSRYQHKNFRLAYYNTSGLGVDNIKQIMAEKTLAYLGGKLIAAQRNGEDNALQIEVKLKNINDFSRLKSIIENSNLAQDLKILSVSKDNALVSLTYSGRTDIIDAFAPYGLNISIDQNSRYIAYIQ